jgi:5-methyltetrahydrofolate--homocysteine methyltransferase
MDQISELENKKELIQKNQIEAENELNRSSAEKSVSKPSIIKPTNLKNDFSLPIPKSWGIKVVKDMPLAPVFQHLSINELFRLSWGAKNAHGEAWEKIQNDYNSRLEIMKREAVKDKWLKPQAVYGFFPVQSSGNSLIVYDWRSLPTSLVKIEEFRFPRQEGGENLCLADYFASVESGLIDTMALQVVTVGQDASIRFDSFQAKSEYSEGYFTHGLAVQTAEATADFLHDHIRRELGIEPERGKRYSWGYPAIPELEDHRKVFDLLLVEKELGMSLTAAYQLVPEQSTAAIIVHHPQAKYFNIGTSRISQLMKE